MTHRKTSSIRTKLKALWIKNFDISMYQNLKEVLVILFDVDIVISPMLFAFNLYSVGHLIVAKLLDYIFYAKLYVAKFEFLQILYCFYMISIKHIICDNRINFQTTIF